MAGHSRAAALLGSTVRHPFVRSTVPGAYYALTPIGTFEHRVVSVVAEGRVCLVSGPFEC